MAEHVHVWATRGHSYRMGEPATAHMVCDVCRARRDFTPGRGMPELDPMPEVFLYGVNGAEVLVDNPDEAAAEWFADWSETDDDTVDIWKWTVAPPARPLPSADRIIEDLIDYGADNEVCDGWCDSANEAGKLPEVTAAAEALRSVLAANISYQHADKLVAVLTYERGVDGDSDGGVLIRTEEVGP